MTFQEQIARLQIRAAMKRYHSCYDNELYRKATEGKSVEYANALTDEALALCGHPYYRLSRRRWAEPARAYLKLYQRTLEEDR